MRRGTRKRDDIISPALSALFSFPILCISLSLSLRPTVAYWPLYLAALHVQHYSMFRVTTGLTGVISFNFRRKTAAMFFKSLIIVFTFFPWFKLISNTNLINSLSSQLRSSSNSLYISSSSCLHPLSLSHTFPKTISFFCSDCCGCVMLFCTLSFPLTTNNHTSLFSSHSLQQSSFSLCWFPGLYVSFDFTCCTLTLGWL